MMACCGLACDQCPAYLATQSGDLEALERVLVRWSAEFDVPRIAIEDMLCDGCSQNAGRINGYCRDCEIRSCATARELNNCAECDQYICDALNHMLMRCDALPEYWAYTRPARESLQRVRAALQH